MRYIDSGCRNPMQALGAWLQKELTPSIVELRWQSGFSTAEALPFFPGTLERLAANDQTAKVLLGSNDPGTLAEDVRRLVELLGLPRTNAELGILKYDNAKFHPKVYH